VGAECAPGPLEPLGVLRQLSDPRVKPAAQPVDEIIA
jgi:hypothetical protein